MSDELDELRKQQVPMRNAIEGAKWQLEKQKILQEESELRESLSSLQTVNSRLSTENDNLNRELMECRAELEAAKKLIEAALPTKEEMMKAIGGKIGSMAFDAMRAAGAFDEEEYD